MKLAAYLVICNFTEKEILNMLRNDEMPPLARKE
jgi:hypothetical protein